MSAVPLHIPGCEDLPRAWMRTLSGRRVHLVDPSPLDVDVADFVWGIARESRWNGQTRPGPHGVAYSVCQHSIMVHKILRAMFPKAPAGAWLWAKVHDFSETIVKDMVSPLKNVIGPAGFHEVEERVAVSVRVAVGLPRVLPPLWEAMVRAADRCAAATEALDLCGWSLEEVRSNIRWRDELTPETSGMVKWKGEFWPVGNGIEILTPQDAFDTFMAEFTYLQKVIELRGLGI